MVKKSKKAKYNKKYFKKNRKTNKHINRTFRKKYTKKRGGTMSRTTPNRERPKKENIEKLSRQQAFLRGMELFEPDKSTVPTRSEYRRESMDRLRSAKRQAIKEDKEKKMEEKERLSRIANNDSERTNRLSENTYKKVSKRSPSQQPVTNEDKIKERSKRAAESFKNQ